jgi:hypothetical protein
MRTAARVVVSPGAVRTVRTDSAAGQVTYFRAPLLFPNGENGPGSGGRVREALTASAGPLTVHGTARGAVRDIQRPREQGVCGEITALTVLTASPAIPTYGDIRDFGDSNGIRAIGVAAAGLNVTPIRRRA